MKFVQAPNFNDRSKVITFVNDISEKTWNMWKFGKGEENYHVEVFINYKWYPLKQGDWVILNNDGTFFRDLNYLEECPIYLY